MRGLDATIDVGRASGEAPGSGLWRCIGCGGGLEGPGDCPECGRSSPVVGGIVEAIGPLSGTNRVAASFYDGPLWPRFRPWEQLFLWFNGPGPARARRQVLRHLPEVDRARVLEVGIGDGENLPHLPTGWTIHGVDIARSRLSACLDRAPGLAGRLAWAEAEALPFADATFDAVYTVGGFNFFRDPFAAIAEMLRVARPGGTVVVADEDPDLIRFSPGRALGLDVIDTWGLRAMGLDAEFVSMVQNYRIDIRAIAGAAFPGHRRFPIWHRLGYCLVNERPTAWNPHSRTQRPTQPETQP